MLEIIETGALMLLLAAFILTMVYVVIDGIYLCVTGKELAVVLLDKLVDATNKE